jgi:hypothetical protein
MLTSFVIASGTITSRKQKSMPGYLTSRGMEFGKEVIKTEYDHHIVAMDGRRFLFISNDRWPRLIDAGRTVNCTASLRGPWTDEGEWRLTKRLDEEEFREAIAKRISFLQTERDNLSNEIARLEQL